MIFYTLFILPLERLMEWLYASFYGFTTNYGLSIILLSLTVNVILLPLYAIAERLKNNERKEKGNLALELDNVSVYGGAEKHYYVREIYRRHGYHPLKSLRVTLGILIQVPFFIAAYRFLGHYEDFSGIGFLFIEDLSRPDALLAGVNILPFVMTGVNLLSAFVFTRGMDKREKFQLYCLSALFLALLYSSAAALVFYWTMNNVFSLGKSWFLNRNAKSGLKEPAADVPQEQFGLKKTVEAIFNHPQGINVVFVLLILTFYLGVAYFLSPERHSPTAAMTSWLMLPLLGIVFVYFSYQFIKHFRIGFIQLVALILMILFWTMIFILGADHVLKTHWIPHGNRLKVLICLLEVLGIGVLIWAGREKYEPILKMTLNRILCHEGISSKLYVLNTFIFVLILFFINPSYIFFSSPKHFGGDISILIFYILKTVSISICALLIPFFILKKLRFALTYIVTLGTVIVSIYSFIYIRDLGMLRNLRFVKEVTLMHPGILIILLDFFILFTLGYLLHNFFTRIQKSFSIFSFIIFLFSIFQVSHYVSNQYKYNEGSFSISQEEKYGNETRKKLRKQFSLYEYNEESFSTSQEEKFDNESRKKLRKQFSLSSSGVNILVLVLDAFPTKQFNKVLEKHPEFYDILDGFTWYRNTVSTGNFTVSAEPALVGGHALTVEKMNRRSEKSLYDILIKAWKRHSDYFTSLGFKMVYYNPPYVTEEDFIRKVNINLLYGNDMIRFWESEPPDHVSERVRNAIVDRDVKVSEIFKQPVEYYTMILHYLSLFKGNPYFIKSYLYKRFLNKTGNPREVFERYIDAESFFHSLNMLTNDESESPKFHFFWHDVTGRPMGINKNGDGPPLEEIRNGTFTDDNAVEYTVDYVFKQLKRFFNSLKSLNIYDSTNIILVGDHGSAPYGPGWNENAIYALLMVKEINTRGAMRIDNETLMSNADLLAITKRMASGKSTDHYRDPTQTNIDRELEYWVTTHGNWDSLLKNNLEVDYTVRVKKHVYNEKEWEINYH